MKRLFYALGVAAVVSGATAETTIHGTNRYAYGANIGWLDLRNITTSGVAVGASYCTGYVWSANCGWIGFSNEYAQAQTERLAPAPDSDGDGLPDDWESRRAGNLTELDGIGGDADGDGAPDAGEYAADTDPLDPADRLEIVSFSSQGGTNTMAWRGRPTRFYRLETTNRLEAASGSWAAGGGGLMGPAEAPTLSWTETGVGGSSGFYRVRAVLPLSE